MARTTLHLRPHWRHFGRSLLSLLILLVPIFLVLYWLTIPNGPWIPVVIAQFTVLLGCAFALFAFSRTRIWLNDQTLSERGFLGLRSTIPVGSVASILFVDIYRFGTLDTLPHLFVVGHDGKRLLRMRGQFWSPAEMETVAEHLGVPPTRVAEPITMHQFSRQKPKLLYWFETFISTFSRS